MKYLLSLLILLSSTYAFSQECGFLSDLDVGDHWKYSSFNHKDKSLGDASYMVKDKRENNDSTIYEIESKTQDGKDEIVLDFEMSCYEGTIYMSMQRIIGPMISKMENMDIEVQAEALELPVSLSVGDSLNDAEITIKVDMGAMTMNMSVLVTNRYVLKKEKITTPAGEFDCYVIEQTTKVKTGMGTMTTTTKEWYSTKYGMVRSESYDKKGKLESYTVLTEKS